MTAGLMLKVINPERLRPGSTPSYRFGRGGGVVGASGDMDWCLQDDRGALAALHSEIRWLQDRWCLIDRCGRTRLNGMEDALPTGRPVSLREGDIMVMGALELRACVTRMSVALPGESRMTADLLALPAPTMTHPFFISDIDGHATISHAWRTVCQQLIGNSPELSGDLLRMLNTPNMSCDVGQDVPSWPLTKVTP